MEIVGDELASSARASVDEHRFDLFGRSAYNRYYYAVFLNVRAVLRRIDSGWGKPAHAAIPTLLRDTLPKRLKKHIQRASRTGLISDGRGKQMYSVAASAASELSSLLDSAREVRRIADYEPELTLTRNGRVIMLGTCTLDAAKKWTRRGEIQAATILRIYAELGLI
jgi:hypothetical protein